MELSDYISLGALVVSVVALIISKVTSTKKYELSSAYRQDLLEWHNRCVEMVYYVQQPTQPR